MTNPNRLSQFWQELKRRNVVRVVTVYAGAAFVIIELINNITEPLNLPEWTPTLVIVLLAIGFPIVIIFSWIYDVHPEEGMIMTEPADKVKVEDLPRFSNGWKIASYISFVVILGLILLNVFPRTEKKAILETSIAVLPLIDLSNSDDISSIGFTDEIIMELQKIKAFDRVLSLTSTMQYAEQRPTIPEIGEKLNVNYLVEGTIQKKEDIISINIQVIIAKEDNHIWADEFDEPWENRFLIQDRIALRVAEELQAIITTEEMDLIEKVPTHSLMAHNLYQKGHEAYLNYVYGRDTSKMLQEAEILYRAAMIYDSSYANLYLGLANTYWEKEYSKSYFLESFLDSALVLVNKALHFDSRLAEAYTFRGKYYFAKGLANDALEEYNKALRFNPNDYVAYWDLASFYIEYDFIEALENYTKAINLHKGHHLPQLLHEVGNLLNYAGFFDESIAYYRKSFDLSHDSVKFFRVMAELHQFHREFEKALELSKMAYDIDSLDMVNLELLGSIFLRLGMKEEGLKYYEKWNDRRSATGELSLYQDFRLALAYWENERYDRAEYYFNQQIESIYNERALGRLHDELLYTYFDLAAIQAFKGEKQDALENLRIFKEKQQISFYIPATIVNEPFFDDVKDDPEFKDIFQEIEAKYQAGHERVKQWLEENDML